MSAALFLAASLMVAPDLDSGTSHQFLQAFPPEALRARESAAVELVTWSDPDGRIYRCEGIPLIGKQRYADYACARLRNRRTETPKSPDGSPAHGWRHTIIKYAVEGSASASSVEDLPSAAEEFTFQVADLPDNQPAEIGLIAYVDAQGQMEACEARPEDAASPYTALACRQVANSFVGRLTDREGNAVPFVAAVNVKLVKEPAEAL